MKEASGELSMTVITIIAVSLIVGLLYFMWPTISNRIEKTWTDATDTEEYCRRHPEDASCK